MSTSITRFTATGYVLADPDEHSTGAYTIVTFPVAINYKDQPMVKVRCKAFNQLASTVRHLIRKGSLVTIDGHNLTPFSYINQQGQPATILDIDLDQFRILDRRDNPSPDPT